MGENSPNLVTLLSSHLDRGLCLQRIFLNFRFELKIYNNEIFHVAHA
jgi:hypothetical protein